MTIGERIRKLRGSKGMSQDELAGKVDISKGHLNRLEKGSPRHSNPTLSTIQKFARSLGVNIPDLMDDDSCTQTGALLAKVVSTENERLEAVGALEDASARLSHAVALLRQRHAQPPEQEPCAGRP